MKQTSEKRKIESSGLIESNSFAIKTSPQAFQLLSSGLYTNKIKAVLRELGCNAVDAHTSAGCKDKPIEVKLPNALDKQFYVKDFGTGLSHDKIMRLYTTYFDSTKQESDDFIGGFGVGSKSPFAYTDSFTVESRYDGVKRIYSAYVNEDGIPTITLMGENPTDEPNGLTIGFPVKPQDFDEFKREAIDTYKWFPVKPVIKGVDLTITQVENLRLGNFWRYENSGRYYDNRDAVVRMGSVAYPIDNLLSYFDAVDESDPDFKYLKAVEDILGQSNWVIDLPIGTSLVAASREALQFDKKSIASLKRAIVSEVKTAALELHQKIEKESKNIRDYFRIADEYRHRTFNYNSNFLKLLEDHNKNYSVRGLRLPLNEYPELIVYELNSRSSGDFYRNLKYKATLSTSLDKNEVQRRLRRKIKIDALEIVGDHVTDLIWGEHSKNIISEYPETLDTSKIDNLVDLVVAKLEKDVSCPYVILPNPDADAGKYKKSLKRLEDFLDIKAETLEKPVRPPPKKKLVTDDIYGLKITNSQVRAGEVSKLTRTRMVTSEVTSKIEEDQSFVYAVFDKKSFPSTTDHPLTVYNKAFEFKKNIKSLSGSKGVEAKLKSLLPADGVIMIEKNDVKAFKELCPDSITLEQVLTQLKKDNTLFETAEKEYNALPVKYETSNLLSSILSTFKSFKDKNAFSKTEYYKQAKTWYESINMSDDNIAKLNSLTSVLSTGKQMFGWKVAFKTANKLVDDKELTKFISKYPLLSKIPTYYDENIKMAIDYIQNMEELEFYRTHAVNANNNLSI